MFSKLNRFSHQLIRVLNHPRVGHQIANTSSKSSNATSNGRRSNIWSFLVGAVAATGFVTAYHRDRQWPVIFDHVHNGLAVKAAKIDTTIRPKGGKNKNQYNFVADVVEQISPAVVSIEHRLILNNHHYGWQQMATATGSGFIVQPNGMIVTNAHVVGRSPTVSLSRHQDQLIIHLFYPGYR